MIQSPYRTAERPQAEPPASRHAHRSCDVAGLMSVLWLLALGHVAVAWRAGELGSRALDLAWLVLLVAPFVVRAELAYRPAERRAPPPGDPVQSARAVSVPSLESR